MYGYLGLAIVALIVAQLGSTYRAFARNLEAAKQSGLPYICLPIYVFNKFWLVTQRLWLPFIRPLARIWPGRWIDLLEVNFEWHLRHTIFKELGCDVFLVVAPRQNILYVADAEAHAQITSRRTDFPKPTYMYTSVDLFGKSVVSTEGAVWRQHRKVMSPPFSEKNNMLVWKESLHQAECMITGWVGKNGIDSGPVYTIPTECMRLSLHIISRAGFGVRLFWPHENQTTAIPQGHQLTYKDALEKLLHNLIPVMLAPRWLLNTLPVQACKDGSLALKEWGQYMREMYEEKKDELKRGESSDGMDLMGALVRGSGLSEDNLNGNGNTDPEKASSSQRLLSDEEILGNCFTLILAGHETTANSIHFSMLFLSMHMDSQRRLQQELDELFGDKPVEEWDYDNDMPKLFGGMTGAVMNEELRLLSPVVGIPKTTAKDQPQGLVLGGRHFTVPANAHITLNAVATHRNPRYWPHTSEEDLNEFRPERWLLDPSTTNTNTDEATYETIEGVDAPDRRPDTAASLYRPPKGAFIPFSEGYRSCLGRRFAQIEVLAVVAYIFKHYSVELDVSEHLSDADFTKASAAEKLEAWKKADANARYLLQHGMFTIITMQMREGKLPFRIVKRGSERMRF